MVETMGDATTGTVVGRELYENAISGKNLDEVQTKLSAHVGEHALAVCELDLEHHVRKRLGHHTFNLDRVLFFHTTPVARMVTGA